MENYDLFISNPLDKNPEIKCNLDNSNINYYASSLIEFQELSFRSSEHCNWLFFYSKNGIRFYFNKEVYSSEKKYAVLSEASATYFEEITSFKPDFCGNGNILQTAVLFNNISFGTTVCFVRAQDSRNSVKELLGDSSQTEDLIVYKNKIKKNSTPFFTKIACLTSPMNAEAFAEQCLNKNDVYIVSIGPSTSKKILELNLNLKETLSAPKLELFYTHLAKKGFL